MGRKHLSQGADADSAKTWKEVKSPPRTWPTSIDWDYSYNRPMGSSGLGAQTKEGLMNRGPLGQVS